MRIPITGKDSRRSWERLLRTVLKRRPKPRGKGGGLPEPVEPDSPRHLTGGAAAALEFDD